MTQETQKFSLELFSFNYYYLRISILFSCNMKKDIPEHISNDVFNEIQSSLCVWKRQNYELHCRRFGGLLIS
jgi:hypothetical protein